jgi:actin-related protein 3
MYRDFGRRLQRDIKRLVDQRLSVSASQAEGRLKVVLLFIFTLKYKKKQYKTILKV